MIGIINQDGKRVAHRKLDCDLHEVVEFLEPWTRRGQTIVWFVLVLTFEWRGAKNRPCRASCGLNIRVPSITR
jgi:hypothetical protein